MVEGGLCHHVLAKPDMKAWIPATDAKTSVGILMPRGNFHRNTEGKDSTADAQEGRKAPFHLPCVPAKAAELQVKRDLSRVLPRGDAEAVSEPPAPPTTPDTTKSLTSS